MNPVFLGSPSGCRYLTLDFTTKDTTTPVTPESLKGASTVSALRHLAQCAYFIFSPFRFQPLPVQVLYYSYRRVLPNHGMGATLLYANRELTYTPCLTYSAARTLRTGGGSRNALLQRRFRSAISRSSLRVKPDSTPEIKCEYNCEWISRLYLASDLRTTPPRIAIIATLSDIELSRPDVCVRSSLQKAFVFHI